MEYTINDLHITGSIGSVKEQWWKAPIPYSLLNDLFDSLNFNFPYTLRLQKSVTIALRDGYKVLNGVHRRFVTLDTNNSG